MWLVSDAAHLTVHPGNKRLIAFFTNLCLDPHIRRKQERACHCLLQMLIEKEADQVGKCQRNLFLDFIESACIADVCLMSTTGTGGRTPF